jgi:hypothetical protein
MQVVNTSRASKFLDVGGMEPIPVTEAVRIEYESAREMF